MGMAACKRHGGWTTSNHPGNVHPASGQGRAAICRVSTCGHRVDQEWTLVFCPQLPTDLDDILDARKASDAR
jgi:hypothetical protein